MPEVSYPHPLDGVTSRELTENSVDAVAKTAQERASPRSRIPFLGGVWSHKLYTHPRQIFRRLRRMVVAIPDEQARGGLGDLRHHSKLVDVGRGHRETGDEARPANPCVHTEAVEGLLEEGVFTEGRFPAEAPAAVGASEHARRQVGERIVLQ